MPAVTTHQKDREKQCDKHDSTLQRPLGTSPTMPTVNIEGPAGHPACCCPEVLQGAQLSVREGLEAQGQNRRHTQDKVPCWQSAAELLKLQSHVSWDFNGKAGQALQASPCHQNGVLYASYHPGRDLEGSRHSSAACSPAHRSTDFPERHKLSPTPTPPGVIQWPHCGQMY